MAKTKGDFLPFSFAADTSGAVADALVPFLPKDFKIDKWSRCSNDPVGSVRVCMKFQNFPRRRRDTFSKVQRVRVVGHVAKRAPFASG